MISSKLMKTNQLSLLVRPNSSKNSIVGWQEDRLKIKLKAFPEKGKANKELISFLAEKLNISKGNIKIISGETSNYKELSIEENKVSDIISKLPPK